MKMITFQDLDSIALGAKVLGSGGGGNPKYPAMIAKQRCEGAANIPLYQVEEILDDALVAPICFMGAPLVGIEKLPSGREFLDILALVEKIHGRKVDYILPGEIGGGNALGPFTIPQESGYKVLDADLLGRAFPELQMSAGNLFHIPASPAFLSDFLGNTAIVQARDSHGVERMCRSLTVSMGSRAALCFHTMSGKEAKQALVRGSISRALQIGRTMETAKDKGENPIQALVDQTGGKLLGSGVIVDINQKIERGFLNGTVKIEHQKKTYEVLYQNEYLAVLEGDVPIASTPDILMLFENESGIPITSESLTYGQRVAIVGLPAPEIWTTAAGLNLVGPQVFGYTIDYDKVRIRREV